MTHGLVRIAAHIAASALLLVPQTRAGGESISVDEWPQFRGPDGEGHAPQHGLPREWSDTKNVAWKVPIPGKGWSSPVIRDGKLWVTTATERNSSLRVLCLDCKTGEQIWNVQAFFKGEPGKINPKNSHATPTIVLGESKLYAHFGAHGTACLSSEGRVLWKAQTNYYHHHGPAGSPVVVGDLLIYSCDGFDRPFYDRLERPDVDHDQFVVALDTDSGAVRWKSPRKGRHSYSTPLTIDVDGKSQVISAGGDRVVAYDPASGKEIWSCRYNGYSVVPRPVYAGGLVFICTGFDEPSLLAIRPDGQGDVSETHVAWTLHESVPLTASPLAVGDELYIITDGGIASCLDVKSGRRYWRNRLPGKYSASPLYADGRIYFQTEAGVTHVIAPGKSFRKLATNRVKGETLASMAAYDRSFFIRTDRMLYRITEKTEEQPVNESAGP